ncbi:protein of unknown function [Ralstonia solanacearum PSI07]|nr:protein of unknown function [Ralstonia solanacearum PSI07]
MGGSPALANIDITEHGKQESCYTIFRPHRNCFRVDTLLVCYVDT